MTDISVPLVDLSWQHRIVAEELTSRWDSIVRNSDFILGNEVDEFEQSFARFSGSSYCIGVANGTDAIELALRACNVGPGSEVILPTNSFAATGLAVLRAGARPIFVDCDPRYFLIDPTQVERAITSRTQAVIPVHLYGQIAPMDALHELCDHLNISIISDAAQCHGATQDGHGPAHNVAAAATSFYPGKNLGAYGDGGAILTDSYEVATRARKLRNYGGSKRYEHSEQGFNSRLDSIQAAVLNVKLSRLQNWNKMRNELAERYKSLLNDDIRIETPITYEGNTHVWHLYVVRLPNRNRTLAKLQSCGIQAAIHYPVPIHLQPAFAFLNYKPGDFPVSEMLSQEILSIPIYPGLTVELQNLVANNLKASVE